MEEKTFCPLGSKCVDAKDGVIHRCAWHVMVRGTNRNTGEEVDDWRCAMNWLPMLMIENSAMQRETGAAVESFRNEMVEANRTSQQILLETTSRVNGGSHLLKM
jgi:hypothetical protein